MITVEEELEIQYLICEMSHSLFTIIVLLVKRDPVRIKSLIMSSF